MEVERKFLLSSLPPPKRRGKGELISQGYISAGDPEIRVRSKANQFYLTLKHGSGLVRDEFETRAPRNVFKKLWELTAGKRIRKTRYTIPYSALKWEIDRYYGHLKGLCTAEVELDNPCEVVRIPFFLDIREEITSDSRYKNKDLATRGLPAAGRDSKGGHRHHSPSSPTEMPSKRCQYGRS